MHNVNEQRDINKETNTGSQVQECCSDYLMAFPTARENQNKLSTGLYKMHLYETNVHHDFPDFS